ELVAEGVAGGDVGGRFEAGVPSRLADERRRDSQADPGIGEAEQERRRAQPVVLGEVAGDERRDRDRASRQPR
ncbi:MAG TPA: hypothetical protein VF065_18165, partial [Ilumatobacter sp.]